MKKRGSRQFQQKVGALRDELDQESVRGEAAEMLSTLIESVTVQADGEAGHKAEAGAQVSDLLVFATNDKAARRGGVVVL